MSIDTQAETLVLIHLYSPHCKLRAKAAQDTVSDAKEVLASAGLKPTGVVLSGNTRAEILKDAKQWGADLIFVGSHGRRGFKRLLLGSVSEGVAMDAHCSVVVVRGRRKTAT